MSFGNNVPSSPWLFNICFLFRSKITIYEIYEFTSNTVNLLKHYHILFFSLKRSYFSLLHQINKNEIMTFFFQLTSSTFTYIYMYHSVDAHIISKKIVSISKNLNSKCIDRMYKCIIYINYKQLCVLHNYS